MPDGENSTVAGEVGSTVSRNLVNAISSRRAPFRERLPTTREVSIRIRGDEAMATSRLTSGALEAPCKAGTLPAGVAAPLGEVPGCAVGFAAGSGSAPAGAVFPSSEY